MFGIIEPSLYYTEAKKFKSGRLCTKQIAKPFLYTLDWNCIHAAGGTRTRKLVVIEADPRNEIIDTSIITTFAGKNKKST